MPKYSPVCSDANLLVRLLTDQDDGTIRELWGRWQSERRSLIAPMLLRYEITNAVHRLRGAGLLGADRTRQVLQEALDLPIALAADPDLHAGALDFAERFRLPAAYDAHYLALADREGAEFWTTDRRLANTVRHALPWVHLVEERPPSTP